MWITACYIMDKGGMKVVLDISNNVCASCVCVRSLAHLRHGRGVGWPNRSQSTEQQEEGRVMRYRDADKSARSSSSLLVIRGCQ